MAGSLALFHKLEKTELPLGLLNLMRTVRGSFVFPLVRPPTYKYWRHDYLLFTALASQPPRFSFGEGSFPLAKVLSELVFL